MKEFFSEKKYMATQLSKLISVPDPNKAVPGAKLVRNK